MCRVLSSEGLPGATSRDEKALICIIRHLGLDVVVPRGQSLLQATGSSSRIIRKTFSETWVVGRDV
jgi:hypothetical protein